MNDYLELIRMKPTRPPNQRGYQLIKEASDQQVASTSEDSILNKIYDELLLSKEQNRLLEQRIANIEKIAEERADKKAQASQQHLEKIVDSQKKAMDEWKAKNDEEMKLVEKIIQKESHEIRKRFKKFSKSLSKNGSEYTYQLNRVQEATNEQFKKLQDQVNLLGNFQLNSNLAIEKIVQMKFTDILGNGVEAPGDDEETSAAVIDLDVPDDKTIDLSDEEDDKPDEHVPKITEKGHAKVVAPEVEKRHWQTRRSRPISPESVSSETSFRPNLPCIFCDSTNHISSQCRNYETPRRRRNQLFDKNLCLRCLEPNNREDEHSPCPKKKWACIKCPSSGYYEETHHHPVICPLNEKNSFNNRKSGNKEKGYRPY